MNAIVPPLAVDGPLLSIRRFGTDKLMPQDLVEKKALTAGMMELLEGAVKAKLNIIIAGGTGAGKTTLLNAMSAFTIDRVDLALRTASTMAAMVSPRASRISCEVMWIVLGRPATESRPLTSIDSSSSSG